MSHLTQPTKMVGVLSLAILFNAPTSASAQGLRAIDVLSSREATQVREPIWAQQLREEFRDLRENSSQANGALGQSTQQETLQIIVQYKNSFQSNSARESQNSIERIEGLNPMAVRQSLESLGIEVIREMRATNAVRVRIRERDIEALVDNPNIRNVLVEQFYELKELARPKLWFATDYMGVEELWAQGYTGEGQTVVILDDGIFSNHEVFRGGKIVREACFSTSDSSNGATSVCRNGEDSQIGRGAASYCPRQLDLCVHGTFVANIAAGDDPDDFREKDGVAYGADIIAVQVFSEVENQVDEKEVCKEDEGNTCVRSSTLDQFEALDWVLSITDEYTIAAVNMSLGGDEEQFDYCPNNPLNDVIQDLRDQDILATISAGNEGYVGAVSAPGCIEPAITVSSKFSSSNAPVTDTNHAEMVDFLAPGYSINAAGQAPDRYISASGSSAAAPMVAGAIALLRSVDPGATADQIEYALKASGDKITRPNWNWETPTIQAAAAAQRLDETIIPNGTHVLSVFSSGNPGGTLSFLRFYNTVSYAEDVRVTLRDDVTGTSLGTFEENIPSNASVQFQLEDIEASLGIDVTDRWQYTAIVNSSFFGYVQHVIWNPGGASLTNITSCLDGVSASQNRLINLHTKRVAAGYPSWIDIHNGGYSVDDAKLGVYEAATGEHIGSVVVTDILPATTAVVEAQEILDVIEYNPGDNDYHFNLVLRRGFDGSIAHIVDNEGAGVLTNMSDKCVIR